MFPKAGASSSEYSDGKIKPKGRFLAKCSNSCSRASTGLARKLCKVVTIPF